MRYHVPESLNADRSRAAFEDAERQPWTPSPLAGVERKFLERIGGEVARATSIVRYAAGSSFSEHIHDGGEEYLVLEGVFSDASGDHPAGTYVRNPPGSRHAPFTREGCTIFVKLRQMHDGESELTRVDVDEHWQVTDVPGLSRRTLFEGEGEGVAIEQLRPGSAWQSRKALGGEEILVLEGELSYGSRRCAPLCWLRIPAGSEAPISSGPGCRYWVKRGHLGG